MDNSDSYTDDLSRVVPMRAPEQSSGGMAADIEINYTSALRLARILDGLARELIGLNGTMQLSVQDPELCSALEHAERDWHEQRHRVATFADQASRSVRSAVAAYCETDGEIVRAARTP